MRDLNGAVAVVAGGASGMGESVVRALDAQNVRIVILDRDKARADAIAGELAHPVTVAEADVTDAGAVVDVFNAAERIGPLRIAVATAGIGGFGRLVDDDGNLHPVDLFRRIIDVNLVGTFNVMRAASGAIARSKPLADGERGVIVTTASTAAFEGQIGQVAYAASKAALVGLTLPAARDLMSLGIRVVTIAPGTFDTPMAQRADQTLVTALEALPKFPRRSAHPHEYADLVDAIIANSYLNGTTIRLDAALRTPPSPYPHGGAP
jgi:NAD(P)-dependent dehydrogenase (short-subunit alcohol dehydrogenase family)